jgi:hypothetical protein
MIGEALLLPQPWTVRLQISRDLRIASVGVTLDAVRNLTFRSVIFDLTLVPLSAKTKA